MGGGAHVLDEAAAADAAAGVSDTLECVFDAVTETCTDTAALLASIAAAGRRPSTADLAALRPLLHAQLETPGLVSGAGFVAAPGLLSDAPAAWLEWWQTGPGGEIRPLLLDLDPEHSAYADYTHWEWFALARDTGQRAVAGPYVDYLCSDEYSLTLSVPVTVGGRFMGVAAADVYLPRFEAALMPVLQRLPGPACLVNSRGRVAVSTDARRLAGSLLKGPDFGKVLTGPADGAAHDGLHLRPCGGVPLILVTTTAERRG
ncbi:MAG: cache domain-containing protein [Streptomyces sp.]|uniref:cache domain-containing protein n=1 Tax=Streptomyces sp. TaxID=1931 RepID=UPI003D6BBEA7